MCTVYINILCQDKSQCKMNINYIILFTSYDQKNNLQAIYISSLLLSFDKSAKENKNKDPSGMEAHNIGTRTIGFVPPS